ncbi:MAG: shikimate dehydrogenase [Gomphosphaeria aponina SAG 52.96 = DSM 107014]|uniref:Shikimate dehydrogenase (NADP(+)) n=1 Tax=Gomphosphaeria aponina SAG 52.96 = DSM 107014 TaxID=1521640 RepID=A0A941GQ11_9CHRO|nr:shikimate dehydrogenase [Gomphosphaeria aponina SAG 52.96 = DSM 107014]
MITGKTKLLGVIGDPIEHSLSPVMHNAAIASLNLDYVYLPFRLKREDLVKAIAGLAAINLLGFNVTIPHKQAIIPLLSQVSQRAQMVGAVNTVFWTPQGWSGTNTDVAGFVAPLKALNRDWTKITPVILGNGGAARAVVVGCAELGCPEIRVVGRDKEKLDYFKQSWANSPLDGAIRVHSLEELPGLVWTTELLVNTTPVGMYPNVESSPLAEELMGKIQPGAIAYDLIYNPRPTKWLKAAAARGAIAIDGLEMLVQQGAAALEIWLQQPVPADVMRQACMNC